MLKQVQHDRERRDAETSSQAEASLTASVGLSIGHWLDIAVLSLCYVY